MSIIDFGRIALPDPKDSRMRSGLVPKLTYYRTKVAAIVLKKSVAELVQSAIILSDRRNWPEREELLIAEAVSAGITPEDFFLSSAIAEAGTPQAAQVPLMISREAYERLSAEAAGAGITVEQLIEQKL